MMRLRLLVPMLGLVSMSLFASACSTDDGTDTGGEGGAGGQATTPTSGTAGENAGGEPGAGGACADDSSGDLLIEIEGLPDGVDADVTIDGPDPRHATISGVISPVTSGNYVVSAARVFDDDALVRTVFDATVSAPSFCLTREDVHRVKITYSAIPSSNKLWLPTGTDHELAGFSSADIAESVTAEPSVAIDTIGLGSVAFDKDGNLWASGTTIGEDMLVRIPASKLGESGTREPDIEITVPEIECFPFINHIAFDPHGNLWLSSCDNELYRLNADDLTTSGEKTSDVLFTEVVDNLGIAFDGSGNLWVAGPTLARFDAERLEISDTDAPDLELTVSRATGNTVLGGGEELAFDKAGNLWGVAGSTVYQVASSELDATGTHDVKANVSFDVDVEALAGAPAFDDGNGLWVSLANGTFGRFSPTQLGTSKAAGAAVTPETVITSDVTSTLPITLFPAPQGLPLYHSLPAE